MPRDGRPSKYSPAFAIQAEKLCKLGATDKDLADFFGVNTTTIWRWNSEFPDFCNALKVGKSAADDRVERSLYHKAIGYSFETVKIFMPSDATAPVYAPYTEHVPPSDTACIFWLKNRRPEQWRDKTEHHTFRHTVREMSDDELDRIIFSGAEGSGEGKEAQKLHPPKSH